MTFHIPINELTKEIRTLYIEDKLDHLCIDYLPNAIVSYIKGTDKEVIVYDFNPICKLDNRYTGYNIYRNSTEIVVEFIPTKKMVLNVPLYD
jgi:hypothetical protein